MSVSLSEFFSVELEPHELNRCLDYTSSECKLAAWYGDALLAMFVSQRIYEKDPHNIGTMTRMKAHYVSNLTMKEFLLGHTDASSRLPFATSMSVHSFGTVFEALLELCHKKSGQVVAKSCIDKYCEWVDLNSVIPISSIGISFCDFDSGYSCSTSFASVETHSLRSSDINSMVSKELQCWLTGKEVAKADTLRKEAERVATSVKTAASFCFVETSGNVGEENASTEASNHIHNEILEAKWISNSKQERFDKYYSCCGVRKGVSTCLRPLWIDATRACCHTGSLHIPDKKGLFQHGASHFGKGKTPIWTCCGLTAFAPGCVSTHMGNFTHNEASSKPRPSVSYLTKIRQWLKEYEHVVQLEEAKEVGHDGVVTGVAAMPTKLGKRKATRFISDFFESDDAI